MICCFHRFLLYTIIAGRWRRRQQQWRRRRRQQDKKKQHQKYKPLQVARQVCRDIETICYSFLSIHRFDGFWFLFYFIILSIAFMCVVRPKISTMPNHIIQLVIIVRMVDAMCDMHFGPSKTIQCQKCNRQLVICRFVYWYVYNLVLCIFDAIAAAACFCPFPWTNFNTLRIFRICVIIIHFHMHTSAGAYGQKFAIAPSSETNSIVCVCAGYSAWFSFSRKNLFNILVYERWRKIENMDRKRANEREIDLML